MENTGHFTFQMDIPAAPDRVWHAWANHGEFAHWFNVDPSWHLSVPEFDFRVGGKTRAEFGPAGEPPYIEVLEYLDIEEGRRLVFTSDMVQDIQDFDITHVVIEIEPNGTGTQLTCTESNIPENAVNDRKDGWTATISNLSRHLTGA